MSDDNKLGSALGQIGNLTNKAGNALHKTASDTKKAAKQQTGIAASSQEALDAKNIEAKQNVNENKSLEQVQQEQTKEVVKSLYAKTDPKGVTPSAQVANAEAEKNPDKTVEEIKEITSLRLQLHKEKYYDPTFNPPKKQEEAPAERVERLDEEENKKRWELQKKEEKKKPIAVSQAERKTEARVGSG
ncbi:MAG: hypothetical protein Q7K55_01815 [Candidatus Levybacteria bacterium]|nr:hypothetical protein [Candidatus Levybacteria bacterium]